MSTPRCRNSFTAPNLGTSFFWLLNSLDLLTALTTSAGDDSVLGWNGTSCKILNLHLGLRHLTRATVLAEWGILKFIFKFISHFLFQLYPKSTGVPSSSGYRQHPYSTPFSHALSRSCQRTMSPQQSTIAVLTFSFRAFKLCRKFSHFSLWTGAVKSQSAIFPRLHKLVLYSEIISNFLVCAFVLLIGDQILTESRLP